MLESHLPSSKRVWNITIPYAYIQEEEKAFVETFSKVKLGNVLEY